MSTRVRKKRSYEELEKRVVVLESEARRNRLCILYSTLWQNIARDCSDEEAKGRRGMFINYLMIYSGLAMIVSFLGIAIDRVTVQRFGQAMGVSVLYVMAAMALSGMV